MVCQAHARSSVPTDCRPSEPLHDLGCLPVAVQDQPVKMEEGGEQEPEQEAVKTEQEEQPVKTEQEDTAVADADDVKQEQQEGEPAAEEVPGLAPGGDDDAQVHAANLRGSLPI